MDQLSSRLELATSTLHLRFVGMDSNEHLPLWGPNIVHLDRVGRMVEETLASGKFLVPHDPVALPRIKGIRADKLGLM